MADTAWQAHAHRHVDAARRRIIAALLDDARAEPPADPDVPHPSQRLANKLSGCCRHPRVGWDPDADRIVMATDSCRSRMCPRCSRIRGEQLRQSIRSVAMQLDAPAFLTLTLRSTDDPLSVQLDRLTSSARKLRHRRAWQSHVAGGIQVIEVTWNKKRQQWHPHLHMLVDLHYWPQHQIATEWERVTGDSRIVDVRRLSSRTEAANYVAKYASKGCDQHNLPSHKIPEWAHAMHGKRLAQTFGSLHGARTGNKREGAKSKIEWFGWLGELWHRMEHHDDAAAGLLARLRTCMDHQLPASRTDVLDELRDFFARDSINAPPQPSAPSAQGDTSPEQRSNPPDTGLFNASCNHTTNAPP